MQKQHELMMAELLFLGGLSLKSETIKTVFE